MCEHDVNGVIVVESIATTKILHVVLHVRSTTHHSNRYFRQKSGLIPGVRHLKTERTIQLVYIRWLKSLVGSCVTNDHKRMKNSDAGDDVDEANNNKSKLPRSNLAKNKKLKHKM